jgi:glutathione S-transferase
MSSFATAKPILTYFGMTGRAEGIRLVFIASGTPFEDKYVNFSEWGAMKSTMTGAKYLPHFQAGDFQLTGGRTIAKYVARECGGDFYPSGNNKDLATMDFVMDVVDDWSSTINAAGQGMETEAKLQARLDACTTGGKAAMLFQAVEDAIIGPFVLGDAPTVADFYLFGVAATAESGLFDGVPGDVFNQYPKIQACRKAVATIPRVMKYHDEKHAEGVTGIASARIMDARNW